MQSRMIFFIAVAIAGAIWWILRDPTAIPVKSKKTAPLKVASVQEKKTPKGSLPYSMDDGLIVVAKSHPERVFEALKKLEDTSLQIVPYTNQNDVIVFTVVNRSFSANLPKR